MASQGRGCTPRPDYLGDRLYSFPFLPPGSGVLRPPRREPAGLRRGHSGVPAMLAVRRVKFFGRHSGEMLLTASEDGCVYGWETRSGQLLWRLSGHTGPVKFCRFSPDGHLFASTSCDHTVRLWDMARAKCLRVLKGWSLAGSQALKKGPSELTGPHPWGSELSAIQASGSWDKTIHIWKPMTSSLLVQLRGHITWVKSIAFSPDELRLVSAAYSRMVKIWDCNTGKCLETLKGHSDCAAIPTDPHGQGSPAPAPTTKSKKQLQDAGWNPSDTWYPEPDLPASAPNPISGSARKQSSLKPAVFY
uniref:WD repeat-containing protein 38 isoform X2 n=1 Tax=Callithrix jacchus TaxID=9483 RepID=UPI0023DD665D|nr:WD repeat-containing protein 38 isoform X2 [Callithrix jacchus]